MDEGNKILVAVITAINWLKSVHHNCISAAVAVEIDLQVTAGFAVFTGGILLCVLNNRRVNRYLKPISLNILRSRLNRLFFERLDRLWRFGNHIRRLLPNFL